MSIEKYIEKVEEDFYKEFGHFHAPCNLENTQKSEIDDYEFVSYFKSFLRTSLEEYGREVIDKCIKALPVCNGDGSDFDAGWIAHYVQSKDNLNNLK